MRPVLAFLVLHFLALPICVAQNDLPADTKKLETFLKSLDANYVDSLQTRTIVEAGIRAMLEQLDPHSVYMDAAQYNEASEPLEGKFNGIGIRFHVVDDTLTVLETVEGSPAKMAGILLGDQIIAVGSDTLSGRGMDAKNMATLIKKPENESKPIVVWRSGRQLELNVARAEMKSSSVTASFMLDKRTGYIRLERFSSTGLTDFREALSALGHEGMDNLVFDLRGNSGGYLNVAVKIVDEFLEDRKLIVYTEGLHSPKRETFATSGGRFVDGNLVVLIDEHSASASEIVAGAVQDWDRGLIVGRRSFGKGLVQRTVEFADGSAMRLTISRYYTPSGRSIQKPYDQGRSAYRNELKTRGDDVEVIGDSALVYFTPSKRKVYGGGGITPDVTVAEDTTTASVLYAQIAARGLHYLFAIDEAQRNGTHIKSAYKNGEAFAERYQISEASFDVLKNTLRVRGITFTDEEFARAIPEMEPIVKPLVAWFVYGANDYRLVQAKYDSVILRALDDLEKGTLRELGLNQ